MKYALVGDERREAQSGLSAKCPVCGSALIAKCGEIRVHHWAHRGVRSCDHWWESETEWHRAWKDCFPKECQEVIQTSGEDERHIADVRTGHGLVLEFQYSFLRQEERQAREAFYQRLVWVVNGRRRALDRPRFFEALRTASVINREPLVVSMSPADCALLRDWQSSRAPVYFDFGDSESADTLQFKRPTLWRLDPRRVNDGLYLAPIQKQLFVHCHTSGEALEDVCTQGVERVASYYSAMIRASQSRPLRGFARYAAARQRARRRF